MAESVSLSTSDVVATPDPLWRPRPWRAVILSLFTPLAAHLYNGRPWRAFVSTLALHLWFVAGIAASLVAPSRELRLAFLALTVLAPFTVVPWDAWRIARRTPGMGRRWFQRWYLLLVVLVVWIWAIQPQFFDAVRAYLSEAYRIPAGGMDPTLVIGDHLLVSKWDHSAASRRQVIVFSDARQRNYVQRVVGLPGDTLAMRAHVLLVNGQAIDEPYVYNPDPVDRGAADFQWQREFLIVRADSAAYRPTLGNWGPLVVPPNQYFLLGDNRSSSYDSRYRGFVAASQVRGRARWVYYSRAANGEVHWSRIGVGIR